MTYRQAVQLGAHVRKGEKGSLGVYADSITWQRDRRRHGVEVARDIPFLKASGGKFVTATSPVRPRHSYPRRDGSPPAR